MTFAQYIDNPMGKNNAVFAARDAYRAQYMEKFDALYMREAGRIKRTLYYDKVRDVYFCHIKMPSETVEKFYYDVVIRFYTDDNAERVNSSLTNYQVQFFSNDPAFIYTYLYVFRKLDMLVMDLKGKCPKLSMTQRPVERNAYLDVGKAFEVEDVVFANEARLGALGSGTSSKEIKGSLHINLGGGSTSIVVSSGKDILVSRSSYFCGNLIDEAIMRYLRKERHLMIGEKSAEFIKMKIGSLEFTPENRLLEVPGRDILTSLPHNVTISTNEVRSVILPLAEQLMNHINDVLIVTPPEIASDIQENGVVISGGTALLTGMREYIEKQINLPVRIAPDPIACVANGMRTYIKELLNN